jgi:hypothetical protein
MRGISIDLSENHLNGSDSNRVNREFVSNEIDEKDLRPRKYDDPRILTVLLISIDDDNETTNRNCIMICLNRQAVASTADTCRTVDDCTWAGI